MALNNLCHDWTRLKVQVPVRIPYLGVLEVVFANRVIECAGHFKPPVLQIGHSTELESLNRPERSADIDIARLFAAVIADSEPNVRETLV